MDAEFEVAGHTYTVGKLNALTQFHVSRRLAPILAAMGVSLQSLQAGVQRDLSDFASLLEPVTEMMAKMPEEDVNYVIFTCLGVVKRKVGERWAPVANGASLMYEDIDMLAMLRLVVEVVRSNLGAFMQGLGDTPNSPSP